MVIALGAVVLLVDSLCYLAQIDPFDPAAHRSWEIALVVVVVVADVTIDFSAWLMEVLDMDHYCLRLSRLLPNRACYHPRQNLANLNYPPVVLTWSEHILAELFCLELFFQPLGITPR